MFVCSVRPGMAELWCIVDRQGRQPRCFASTFASNACHAVAVPHAYLPPTGPTPPAPHPHSAAAAAWAAAHGHATGQWRVMTSGMTCG